MFVTFNRKLSLGAFSLFASLAVWMSGATARAAILGGDVIAVDFSDGFAAATNYNVFTAPGLDSSVIRYNGGTPVTGVSLTWVGAAHMDFTPSHNWPSAPSDPYYDSGNLLDATNDFGYSFSPGPFSLTFAGLDPTLTYNVRVYSLTDTPGAGQDLYELGFSVTNGGSTLQTLNSTRGTRWANSLAASGMVFSGVSPNVSNQIVFSVLPDTDNVFFVNAVILEAVGTEAVPEPSTFVLAALGLAGLGLVAWRRRK